MSMAQNYYAEFSHYLVTGDDSFIREYLVDGQNARVLSVYRNGFYKACVDALSANFPVTERLLGESVFQAIAKHYIQAFPPQHGTLIGFGEYFVEFLAAQGLTMSPEVPEQVCDLAMLDQSWLRCLNSATPKQVLTAEDVMSMAEADQDLGDCLLTLSANAQIIQCASNAFEFWQRMKIDGAVPSDFDQQGVECSVLFWRVNGQVMAKPLGDDEALFFLHFSKGAATLAKAFESVVSKYPEFDLTEHFSQCLKNGLLMACNARNPENKGAAE